MCKKLIVLLTMSAMLITTGCSSTEISSQASTEAVTTLPEAAQISTTEALTEDTTTEPKTTTTTTTTTKATTTGRFIVTPTTAKPEIIFTKRTTKKATTTKRKTTTKATTKATTTTRSTIKSTTTNPTTTKTTGPKATSVVTSNAINKIREGFLRLVNQERSKCGAKPLKTHSLLSSYAQTRSKEIITKFSHTRPNGGHYNTIIDRKAYPYSLTAEIIQNTSHIGNRPYTQEDLFVGKESQIVEAYTRIFNNFKNSDKHYKLMTDPRFDDTGIGISYIINNKGMAIFYVVQHLGDPK